MCSRPFCSSPIPCSWGQCSPGSAFLHHWSSLTWFVITYPRRLQYFFSFFLAWTWSAGEDVWVGSVVGVETRVNYGPRTGTVLVRAPRSVLFRVLASGVVGSGWVVGYTDPSHYTESNPYSAQYGQYWSDSHHENGGRGCSNHSLPWFFGWALAEDTSCGLLPPLSYCEHWPLMFRETVFSSLCVRAQILQSCTTWGMLMRGSIGGGWICLLMEVGQFADPGRRNTGGASAYLRLGSGRQER